MQIPYHEWTPCEVYGHNFVDGHCIDCGEDVEIGDDTPDQISGRVDRSPDQDKEDPPAGFRTPDEKH